MTTFVRTFLYLHQLHYNFNKFSKKRPGRLGVHFKQSFECTAMQIEKALINDRLRLSKVS